MSLPGAVPMGVTPALPGFIAQPVAAVTQFVAPPPLAFPFGLGFTNRPSPESECFCCQNEGNCCGTQRPVYYCPADRSWISPVAMQEENCAETSVTVPNAQIFGTIVSFNYHIGLCSGGEMQVMEGVRHVGTVRSDWFCCPCGEQVLKEVIDSAGTSRFTVRSHPCGGGPQVLVSSMDCCGMFELSYPIYGPRGAPPVPLGNVSRRGHSCCYGCYPRWYGYRAWPAGCMSRDDQLLLMGLAHNFEIDVRRQQQRRNGNQSISVS